MLRFAVGVCCVGVLTLIIQHKPAVPTNVILNQQIMIKNGDEKVIRYILPAFYT